MSTALVVIVVLSGFARPPAGAAEPTPERRLLYVAVPGVRDYLEYGGHGLLVFNGSQTLCFVNVNGLLGFEVGDLTTGKVLHRVEVQGFQQGPVKRHGCPNQGMHGSGGLRVF